MSPLQEEVLRLRTLLQAERRTARTDPLTGAANRRAFEEDLAQAGGAGDLVLLDAMNLHTANRILGYDGGDALLRLIVRNCRWADTVYRIGGDEFAMLLPSGTGELVAQRIADRVGRVPLGGGVSFGVSFGVVPVYAGLAGAHARCVEDKTRRKLAWNEPADVRCASNAQRVTP